MGIDIMILDEETRKRIMDTMSNNPTIVLRKIAEELNELQFEVLKLMDSNITVFDVNLELEVADVLIMLVALMTYFCYEPKILEYIEQVIKEYES